MNATAFTTRRPKKIKNKAASSIAMRKMGVASPLGSKLEGMLSRGLVMLHRVTRRPIAVEGSPSMDFLELACRRQSDPRCSNIFPQHLLEMQFTVDELGRLLIPREFRAVGLSLG